MTHGKARAGVVVWDRFELLFSGNRKSKQVNYFYCAKLDHDVIFRIECFY